MTIQQKLPINQLIVGFRNLNEAFQNCFRGKCSKSQHELIQVLKLDPELNHGKSGFLLTDGHHRLVEAMLRQEREVLCDVDTSGFSDYWAIPSITFDFTDTPWQGLEEFADEETLEEMQPQFAIKEFLQRVLKEEMLRLHKVK